MKSTSANSTTALPLIGRILMAAIFIQFASACRANDAHGGVANARNSFGYGCALRLALHAVDASFTPESTVTAH